MKRIWCGLCVLSRLAVTGPALVGDDGRAEIPSSPEGRGIRTTAVGAARSNAVVDSVESSSTVLAIQPGAGIDIGVAPRWAVRFQGDYRATPATTARVKHERFMTGLVFRP